MTQAYPSVGNRFDVFAAQASTQDGEGILYISDDLRKYNYHIFAANAIEGRTGHLHVEVTIDGRFWYQAAVSLIDDVTTNSTTVSIPSGSLGVIKGKFKQLRVKVFGTVELTGAHGWI